MSKSDYHSALSSELNVEPVERAVCRDGIVLCWDVTTGHLPTDFDACDVLYAEPPWRDGMAVFNERVGGGPAYEDVIASVNRVIVSTRRPVVIVTGRHAEKKYNTPNQRVEITLNGAPAIALVYRTFIYTPVNTNEDVIAHLAEEFACIGDFMCGYGNTARIASRHGARWVLADYNPRCVGYVAEHADEWGA